MKVLHPRICLVLAAASLAAACASAPAGPPTPVAEAIVSEDARFQDCKAVAITIDRRSDFRAEVADFLEYAREAECPWARIVVAQDPSPDWGKSQDYVKVRGDVRDYTRSHDLPWVLQGKANDSRLSVQQLRVMLLAPSDEDRAFVAAKAAEAAEAVAVASKREAERVAARAKQAQQEAARSGTTPDSEPPAIEPASNPALVRTLAMQAFSEPQGLFSAAVAEICFAAATERRDPSEMLGNAGYQPSGWVGGRYGTGHPDDRGWFVALGARVHVITRPDHDVCIVNAQDGDPRTLAAHALGALDAVAPAPYAGDCPIEYHCRGLADGRIMLLSLRLRGRNIPPRYLATSGERVGAARALAGAVTEAQLAELSANLARTRPGPSGR